MTACRARSRAFDRRSLGVSGSEQPWPSDEELAALVVGLMSQPAWVHARIAELEARLGMVRRATGGYGEVRIRDGEIWIWDPTTGAPFTFLRRSQPATRFSAGSP